MLYLIIYGTTGITSTTGHGNFTCPMCMRQAAYRQRQIRRWFTLYFIPIIPLHVACRYVECASCGAELDERVLAMQNQIRAEIQGARQGIVDAQQVVEAQPVVDDEPTVEPRPVIDTGQPKRKVQRFRA